MKDYHLLLKKLLKKSNRLVSRYYLIVIPGMLVYTFFLLLSFTFLVHIATSLQLVAQNPFEAYAPSPYAIVSLPSDLSISAMGAAVLDASSHTYIYMKNPSIRFSPASTTKVLSALVARTFWKPTDVLFLKTWEDPEGSGINLMVGEKLTVENLLKAMLMYSANDAAFTVAQNYPGGEPHFVQAMNEKASQIHLQNSHFGDPAGLDDALNYTTPHDMVELASVAMKDEVLSKIVAQKYATISDVSGTTSYLLTNRNILLGQEGVTGIKTGFTDEAKEVLLTRVEKNSHIFYVVVMKSDDRFGDTLDLIRKVINTTTFASL